MSDAARVGEPDAVGACLDCQALYLLPEVPVPRHGLSPAGLCLHCNGLVIGVEPAERRLADVICVVRAADERHVATLRQLVDSWEVAVPSPLASLAELGPVAVSVTTRRAIGTMVVAVMPALLRAAAGRRDPDAIAHALLAKVATSKRPLPLPT